MIQDLKDLQKLLKLCRSQGITEIKLQGVEIRFGDMPQEQSASQSSPVLEEQNKWGNFPDRILTPEELTFYSSGGRPEDLEDKETA
jgi:hypothetical protein